MPAYGLLVALAFLAQGDTGPPDELPWRLMLKDTGEVFYAFFEAEDWDSRQMRIKVLLDEPWKSREDRAVFVVKANIDQETMERERAWPRERRIEEGWKAAGGILVETETGPDWVLASEWELAQEARRLAGVDERPAEEAPEEWVEDEAPVPEPGFFATWGPHLFIVVVAGGLSILVVWALLIR